MSQKPYPGWIIRREDLDPTIMAVIEAEFDEETDFEEEQLAKQMKNEKYVRKLCVLRTLSFPIDIVFGTPMFGFEFAKRRMRMQIDFLKFLFKRISYSEVVKSVEENA